MTMIDYLFGLFLISMACFMVWMFEVLSKVDTMAIAKMILANWTL